MFPVPIHRKTLAAAVAALLACALGACDRRPPAAPATRTTAAAAAATQSTAAATDDPTAAPVETDPAKLLFSALVFRDVKKVAQILDARPELANKEINKTLPLAMACESRQLPIVKVLLDRGADPTKKTRDGHSILWAAVNSDSVPVVKYLIEEKRLDPAAREPEGATLLWAADTRPMAEYLIQAGVDPRAKNDLGDTALHVAARHSLKDVVELLLDAGVPIETRGRWNMPPLHSAASTITGDPRPVVNLLLARGADINARGYKGHTAMHECAFYNRLEMADLLLSRGAEPDLKDDDGKTPTDLAILAGKNERIRLINLLVKGGAKGQLIPLPKNQ